MLISVIRISVMLWREKSVNIQIERNTRSRTGEGKFGNFIWTSFDMVLFGFRCWYYGCWFLQVRESQTSFTFLFSKEFQTVCESLVPVIWGWIRKKRNHRGHLPYCWTVPRNLISPVRKFELQYKKMLIRRCFQTVFILYINKPTILHSIKLRLNEGKLKDVARKLSSGSVIGSTWVTRI